MSFGRQDGSRAPLKGLSILNIFPLDPDPSRPPLPPAGTPAGAPPSCLRSLSRRSVVNWKPGLASSTLSPLEILCPCLP